MSKWQSSCRMRRAYTQWCYIQRRSSSIFCNNNSCTKSSSSENVRFISKHKNWTLKNNLKLMKYKHDQGNGQKSSCTNWQLYFKNRNWWLNRKTKLNTCPCQCHCSYSMNMIDNLICRNHIHSCLKLCADRPHSVSSHCSKIMSSRCMKSLWVRTPHKKCESIHHKHL